MALQLHASTLKRHAKLNQTPHSLRSRWKIFLRLAPRIDRIKQRSLESGPNESARRGGASLRLFVNHDVDTVLSR